MMDSFRPTAKVAFSSLLFATVLIVAGGCDSVLEKEPLDQISDEAVWSDPALADAYLFEAYNQLNLFCNSCSAFYSFQTWVDDALAGDMITGAAWQPINSAAVSIPTDGGAHGSMNYWDYSNIRRTNTIIEQLSQSEFGRDFVAQRTAEARFVRAFAYFEMVKRYGGVPLVTKAQPLDAPEDSIFVERASEQRIYDFIANEMDAIVDDLPETHDGIEGRASRYAALGLKSRAMLYAASIAEFGNVQMNGLLGIPSSEADRYWQASYDASKEIIDSGPHSLYEEYDDPERNYYQLFNTDIPENPEAIFGFLYDGAERGHSNTLQNLPMEYATSWGANAGATYGFTMMFNYQDGSSGQLSVSEVENQQWSSEALFGNRDPRFRGTVLYPGDQFRERTVTFHEATVVDGEEVTSGTVEGDWPASAPSRNRTTGLLIAKRTADDQIPTGHNQDDTDYIELRLGEIYLNAAEAAFYLGQQQEALDYVNRIRERAQMSELSQISEEAIRHERQVELAMEEHRYWDLRRWRTAEEELDGLRTKGFTYTYDWSTKKYNVDVVNIESQARVFQERHYYLPFYSGWRDQNPELVQNPGY